jgi:hypothetical protein
MFKSIVLNLILKKKEDEWEGYLAEPEFWEMERIF